MFILILLKLELNRPSTLHILFLQAPILLSAIMHNATVSCTTVLGRRFLVPCTGSSGLGSMAVRVGAVLAQGAKFGSFRK